MCDSTEKNVCRKYSKESGDGCMESGAPVPGRGKAIASLVLGIVADVFLFITPWVSLVTGLVGLVLACVSKRDGFTGGIRTAGFVVSVSKGYKKDISSTRVKKLQKKKCLNYAFACRGTRL